jgi:hypothetical protein
VALSTGWRGRTPPLGFGAHCPTLALWAGSPHEVQDGHLVGAVRLSHHGGVLWRRRSRALELPLDREDVVAIFDALADIKAWTRDIWLVVVGEDQSDEDES